MKSYMIKQRAREDELGPNDREAIATLATLCKFGEQRQRRTTIMGPPPGSRKARSNSPSKLRGKDSSKMSATEDNPTFNLMVKFGYDNMEPPDKLDFLKVQISEGEQQLRERTDATLQNGQTFDLIIENQRYFATC